MKLILRRSVGGGVFHSRSCLLRESPNIYTELWIQMAILGMFCSQRSRDAQAAKRLLPQALKAVHTQERSVVNVDKDAAYPKAIDELKAKEEL